MVADDQIARSKRIQQRTGKTFHFATRVLPERVREPTYVLYAFFRVADEVVDGAETAPSEEQRRELDRLRDAALGREETDDAVLSAFAELCEEHDIAEEDVETFIEAMREDIDTDRYETYEALEAYMDGSASAVGRMMTAVMDPEDPDAALPHATALGDAFQLSNFLRDVREDIVELDRVYLPQETLREYGVTEAQLKRFEFDGNVEAAMRHELRRAESLYKEGVAGIKYLPEDCQFAVLLAAVLYAEHHALIRERGFDTLTETPELGSLRKLKLFVRTRWAWFRCKDPETVFRRVSCVRYGDSESNRSGAGHADRVPAR
ncbi:phytoene/squalene synthase family protein [Halobaculum magnesiiphilum]|uniref:Phytoene/squalene synthase family protein n=1 Tax=Halobaculum magnesiiphilum TaxID=1017351 RepID=A0A8T8WC59_9EURY|nr:phytoene/squalene synthase family protein [Halobaculum magnesiiphilum]QZP37447.1 phytoene/squalene synthase family protein [Halobaculum magnesiiphilum]